MSSTNTSNFTRNCPGCKRLLTYISEIRCNNAIVNNLLCRACSRRKKHFSPDEQDKIIFLHGEGASNAKISRELNVNIRRVVAFLKSIGKKSNFRSIDQISETEAICSKCHLIKNLNEFQFGRKGKQHEYRYSYCNECRRKQVISNVNKDVSVYLKTAFTRLKSRAKKSQITFNISYEEFIKIYECQDGLCFYTDELLICEFGKKLNRNSLSVDKIIPELGYVKGNIVFTSHKINVCKNNLTLDEIKKWMPSWFERIEKFLKDNHNA